VFHHSDASPESIVNNETLTTAELAARWDMHPGTLVNWRMYKRGPVYRKNGSRVTYKIKDVEAYERSCEITPQVAAGPRPAKRRGLRSSVTG